MQPLQASNTVASSGNGNGKSSTANNNNANSPNNNNNSSSGGGGGGDTAYEFDSNSHSEIQTIIGQELSRKYSSASECTTMSDYTPENTITSSMTSSPPIVSMSASVSQTPDEPTCQDLGQLAGFDDKDMDQTLSEALLAHQRQQQPPQKPDETNTPGNLNHFLLSRCLCTMAQLQLIRYKRQHLIVITQFPLIVVVHASLPRKVEQVAAALVAESLKDLEAASAPKALPVRKISRFSVSPAILTVANERVVQSVMRVDEPAATSEPDNASTGHSDLEQQQFDQTQRTDVIYNAMVGDQRQVAAHPWTEPDISRCVLIS